MSERKGLPKATRFDVFKRDSFKCQYCGRSAPDVILEVDHIKPVSEGGENDMMNLVTSCRDCNRGKGKKELNDNSTIKKQMNELEALNEKREQIEMLLEWKEELINFDRSIPNKIFEFLTTHYPNKSIDDSKEYCIAIINNLIRQFQPDEILDSVIISFNQYYRGDKETWLNALNKIGGICYNRKFKQGIKVAKVPDEITDNRSCQIVFHCSYFEDFYMFMQAKYGKDIMKENIVTDYELKSFFDLFGQYYEV